MNRALSLILFFVLVVGGGLAITSILLSAFAMLTAIAFYLFDVRVTTDWQESTIEPPVSVPER